MTEPPPQTRWRWSLSRRAPDLSARALVVAAFLADFADFANLGSARPGEQRLANLAGCSQRTVRKALRELQDAGLIESTGYYGRAKVWRLIPDTAAPPPADGHRPDASGVAPVDNDPHRPDMTGVTDSTPAVSGHDIGRNGSPHRPDMAAYQSDQSRPLLSSVDSHQQTEPPATRNSDEESHQQQTNSTGAPLARLRPCLPAGWADATIDGTYLGLAEAVDAIGDDEQLRAALADLGAVAAARNPAAVIAAHLRRAAATAPPTRPKAPRCAHGIPNGELRASDGTSRCHECTTASEDAGSLSGAGGNLGTSWALESRRVAPSEPRTPQIARVATPTGIGLSAVAAESSTRPAGFSS